MNLKLSFLYLLLASLTLFSCGLSENTLQVVDLQCEYVSDPLGIDIEIPRFQWKLVDSKNTRGQKQTAYQILVAGSQALLDNNQGDIWDSGIVNSGQSTLVNYGGKKLSSNQVCFWKVRAYDKDKKETAWSPVARFSMGLLDREDWKAAWIQHPDASDEKHIWYRKNFSLDEVDNSAFIHVASMGYHELYLNGEKVDDRILAPALTRLDKRVLSVTYDVSKLLQKGRNTIAIWYGPGWSRYNFFEDQVHPAILVQMQAKTIAGKNISIQTDSSWKCQVSSSKNTGGYHYDDNGGELVDANKYISSWNAVDFDDSGWPSVKETTMDVVISSQIMEPTRIIDTLQTQSITDTIKGIYRADMGRNFTGWLEIKMNGMSVGDTVFIKVADDPNTIQDFGQKNIYICNGKSNETFCNRFNFVAGRYISIEGLKEKPKLTDIKGYVISTALKRTGHFSCSNDLFNQIYETDLWTYRMNTTEGYTSDCPHRERLGYGEVAFATAWGIGLPNYQSGAFYAKLVRDWADVQEENGWINHTAPQINEHYGGPMWSSAGLNISWEYYQTFGDKRILEATYNSSKRWLEFLNRNSLNGILQPYFGGGKFLGDWAAPEQRKEWGESEESLYFNNCVYAMNLETFVNLANLLGNSGDAVLYKSRLDALKQKIQERFFDPEKGIYMNGNQVQTAFAIMRELGNEDLLYSQLAHFEKELTKEPLYFDMGSSGLPVLLKFLTEQHEYNDVVANILSKTDEPSYGYFLKRGETAWPEYWNVDMPSRIHTCFTGIASWFIKCVGGIRPDPENPGYQSFIIKPSVVNELTFGNAETESLYGTIKSSWRKEDGKLVLNVSIPVNSKATVYIPASAENKVAENGKPLAKVEGVTIQKQEKDYLLLEVESGNYEFIASEK